MKARMKAGKAGEKEEHSTSVMEGGISSEPLWAEAMPMGTRKKLSSNEKKKTVRKGMAIIWTLWEPRAIQRKQHKV